MPLKTKIKSLIYKDMMIYLEETIDLAGLSVNIDIQISWCGGQSRYGLDIRREGVAVKRQ